MKIDIYITPSKATAYVGQTVSFICISDRRIQWFFNKGPMPKNANMDVLINHQLKIENVQYDNAGIYTCRTQNYRNNESSYYEGNSVLVVFGK